MLAKSLPKWLLLLCLLLSAAFSNAMQNQEAFAEIAYGLKHKEAAEAQKVLVPLLGSDPKIKVELDQRANRLIVSGPQWAQDMTRQVLSTLDRPAGEGEPRREANNTESWLLRMYRCPAKEQGEVQAKLKTVFSADQFAVSFNAEGNLVFVRGPEIVHQQLSKWYESVETLPTGDISSSGNRLRSAKQFADSTAASSSEIPVRDGRIKVSDASVSTASATESVRRILPIPAELNDRIRKELLQLFGERLQPEITNPNRLRIKTTSGELLIQSGVDRGEWLIEGPAVVVEQMSKLLNSLVRRVVPLGEQQERILLLRREVQPRLKEVISPKPAVEGKVPVDRQGSAGIPKSVGLRPVSFAAFQQDADPKTQDNSPPQGETSPLIPQFEGIEVETLPDLDAIILRGRDRELKQLAEIIEQLEQISRQTQPAIEVVILKHANSEQIGEVIGDTQEDLLGARQGRAQVTALAKPNAMLIIGWGEAVKALKELIEKLDQPVLPETQFEVIRLRYAQAADLQESIQDFFNDRGDLGPVIQSTIDARTNALVVHASPRDLEEVKRLVASLDTPKSDMVQRARVFPIQNSLAADIADTLEAAILQAADGNGKAAMELITQGDNGETKIISGILENTQITVNSRNNSLIVAAPPENMQLIEELIRQLDSPGATARIKIFPIENGDATSLVQTLRALLPSQVGAGAVAQLSSAQGESSLAPLRFTVDVRSNSIIATGSEGDLKIVEAIVMRLDETDAKQRRSLVYQLKNAPATDVALAINDFLRNKRQVEQAAPGADNPFAQLEKEVIVVPEPVANKLILSATPKYFDEIRELIEKLDEQPPQVMIQVLIAEVALGDAREFGIELGVQDSVLFDRSLLGNLITTTNSSQQSTPSGIVTNTQQNIVAASNEPGFNFNNTNPLGNSGSALALGSANQVGSQGLSNFAVGRGNMELGFGGLVLSASSQNISVLLRALQETKRMDILSRPQVLTLDNQPAFIQVGQRVPRIVGSTVNQNGSQNNVTLENVGLILGVTPRISPEGNVVMEIDAEKSSLGPESEGIPVAVSLDGTVIRSPRIDTTTAQATVSAANGETIILGGLITKANRQVHRKVPVLGDIPVLKYLFRFDSVAEKRTELLIILTPHIVRSQEDMERVKQVEFARMSWCAADVVNIHGDINMAPPVGSMISEQGNWEVIYPDVDPSGQSPQTQMMEQGVVQPAPAEAIPLNLNGDGNFNPNAGYVPVQPNTVDPNIGDPNAGQIIPAQPMEMPR
jgi:type II secretion system protein D